MSNASQSDPQFKLRLPASVKAEVHASAAANNRTMNAEIVARLEAGGKTLRDEFAMAALAGLMAQDDWGAATANGLNRFEGSYAITLAGFAYQLADAMLDARQPTPSIDMSKQGAKQ